MDIRTDYQRSQDAKKKKIIDEFRKIKKKEPSASMWRICTVLAGTNGMTPDGVKKLIIRSGALINN